MRGSSSILNMQICCAILQSAQKNLAGLWQCTAPKPFEIGTSNFLGILLWSLIRSGQNFTVLPQKNFPLRSIYASPIFLVSPILKMPPTKDVKRAAVELWKASVPLKQIRAQLKIPERSLRRILDHAKKNSDAPIAERKPGSGRPSVISRCRRYLRHLVESMPRRLEEVIQREGAMAKY